MPGNLLMSLWLFLVCVTGTFHLVERTRCYCSPSPGAVDDFRWYLRGLRRSPATVRDYGGTAARFVDFAARVPADLDPVLRYVATHRDRLAPATLKRELAALRCWFRWRRLVDPEAWAPTRWPRTPRVRARPVMALSDAEVGLLLAQPDLSTFVGLRDHVIMATLYQCGLRASELASLELGSVRLDGTLYVRGKGGHDRLVPFGGAWEGLLETYLRQRSTVGAGKRAALFVTRHGKPLRDGRSVWVIVNRYARKALGLACGVDRIRPGTGKPWTGHYPHQLRYAFATELRRSGCDLVAISQMLGHASLETTTRYLGVDLDVLRAAAAHHPRALRITK